MSDTISNMHKRPQLAAEVDQHSTAVRRRTGNVDTAARVGLHLVFGRPGALDGTHRVMLRLDMIQIGVDWVGEATAALLGPASGDRVALRVTGNALHILEAMESQDSRNVLGGVRFGGCSVHGVTIILRSYGAVGRIFVESAGKREVEVIGSGQVLEIPFDLSTAYCQCRWISTEPARGVKIDAEYLYQKAGRIASAYYLSRWWPRDETSKTAGVIAYTACAMKSTNSEELVSAVVNAAAASHDEVGKFDQLIRSVAANVRSGLLLPDWQYLRHCFGAEGHDHLCEWLEPSHRPEDHLTQARAIAEGIEYRTDHELFEPAEISVYLGYSEDVNHLAIWRIERPVEFENWLLRLAENGNTEEELESFERIISDADQGLRVQAQLGVSEPPASNDLLPA